jgi:hypothetical protein
MSIGRKIVCGLMGFLGCVIFFQYMGKGGIDKGDVYRKKNCWWIDGPFGLCFFPNICVNVYF